MTVTLVPSEQLPLFSEFDDDISRMKMSLDVG